MTTGDSQPPRSDGPVSSAPWVVPNCEGEPVQDAPGRSVQQGLASDGELLRGPRFRVGLQNSDGGFPHSRRLSARRVPNRSGKRGLHSRRPWPRAGCAWPACRRDLVDRRRRSFIRTPARGGGHASEGARTMAWTAPHRVGRRSGRSPDPGGRGRLKPATSGPAAIGRDVIAAADRVIRLAGVARPGGRRE